MEESKNKNKNLEDLYAKPNKNRNHKEKLSKEDKEQRTSSSGNGVNSGAPSGGRKYTEQFESESGELYSRVTKKDPDDS